MNAGRDGVGEGVCGDDLAGRGVDDDAMGLHQLQAPGRQKMIRRRRMRTVDGDEVHMSQHLVQAFPIGGFEPFLDLIVDLVSVVVMARQPEPPGGPLAG